MTIEDMIDELEQNYEAAGFENYYERVLKNASEEQIRKMYDDYVKTFVEDNGYYEDYKDEPLSEESLDNMD